MAARMFCRDFGFDYDELMKSGTSVSMRDPSARRGPRQLELFGGKGQENLDLLRVG